MAGHRQMILLQGVLDLCALVLLRTAGKFLKP
jgi:hypothetical protein